MVTRDLEVVGNDLDAREHALNQRAAGIAALIIGKLNTNQQLGRGDRADRDISVVVAKLIRVDVAAL